MDDDEASFFDFNVDLELGDLLRNSGSGAARDDVGGGGGGGGGSRTDFPRASGSSLLKKTLPLCSGEHLEHSHVAKKPRMPNAGSLLDEIDWEVDDPLQSLRFPGTNRQMQGLQLPEVDALPVEELGSELQERGRRIIPGPAGAILMGKNANDHTEFISRPANGASKASGADFKSPAWLKALQFFNMDAVDPVHYSKLDSTIARIKVSTEFNRVPQMVAIVKNCTPNGCGDAFVTLEDPTGTINGTIHRRLLAETEFGRDIVPGAVILLCKVAVFRPSPRAQYLNITMNNVVQVFRL